MITLLSLGDESPARIWLGELPNLSSDASGLIKHRFKAKEPSANHEKMAAIEMVVPRGGRAYYGLLGALYTPAQSGNLLIQVVVSDKQDTLMNQSLANGLDQVWVGLPISYAKEVIQGAKIAVDLLGSGVLRFSSAAYGVVGSSAAMFHRLADLVVRLLTYENDSLSENQLSKLLHIQ